MANHNEDTDESLMHRIIKRDHQAFATLVKRHTNKFFGTAYRMTGHVQEAEDIVQDAFIKLWKKPSAWDAAKGAKFTTWFYKVVTNQALDHLRKRKINSGGDVLETLQDDRPSAEQSMHQIQQEEMLESAIQTLPERQKAALNLCFYEELSNKDAAEILGVSVKALESLLMRAKTSLRNQVLRQEDIKVKSYG